MEQNSDLEVILSNSASPIDHEHIRRVHELLTAIKGRAEGSGIHGFLKKYFCELFGLERGAGSIIVLGYRDEHEEYVDGTMNKSPFRGNPVSIYDPCAIDLLYQTTQGKEDDGAVLITPDGMIINTGTLLEVTPKRLLGELDIPNHRDIAEKYGFAENVGTRHLHSIAASYRMPDTTIFTLSGSTGHIRVYERMKIIYSPFPEEVQTPQKTRARLLAA